MNEARHVVAGATHLALGTLESQGRLAADEVGKAQRRLAAESGTALPPFPQLGERGRLARHHLTAVRMAPVDPTLPELSGIARVAERDQVGQPRLTRPVALLRLPHNAQRKQQSIIVAGQDSFHAPIRRALAVAPRRDWADLVAASRPRRATDPFVQQALFQSRRRLGKKHDSPARVLRCGSTCFPLETTCLKAHAASIRQLLRRSPRQIQPNSA